MAQKSFDTYTPVEVLGLAFMAHSQQGFVRSGEGYKRWDYNANTYSVIKDNKTIILDWMHDNVKPTQDIIDNAQQEIDRVNGKMMIKRMSDTMTSFENNLVKAFDEKQPVTNFSVSIIASIPNSVEVDRKRDMVSTRLEPLVATSEYVAQLRERVDLHVEVLDVKFIQNSGVYMITGIHNNSNVVKFWWRDQPDISDIITGRNIHVRGTVNKHETNKYHSNMKETMLNRVKIVSI